MRVSAAFPSPYLKASDLQGRRIPVKILRVEMQELGDELKPVVYFEGKAKGLVLNKTNANTISAAKGDRPLRDRSRIPGAADARDPLSRAAPEAAKADRRSWRGR